MTYDTTYTDAYVQDPATNPTNDAPRPDGPCHPIHTHFSPHNQKEIQMKPQRSLRIRSRVNSLSSPKSNSATAAHKASLSPARRRVLELCQSINFGRIENLVIRDGEPVLDPLPLIHRDIKFGGENGPRPELSTVDCCLKKEHIQLFALFDQNPNDTIERLEVQSGLPFRAILQGSNA